MGEPYGQSGKRRLPGRANREYKGPGVGLRWPVCCAVADGESGGEEVGEGVSSCGV